MTQVRDDVIYQGSEVLLLRAAARSLDSACAPWPDPADSEGLRAWLVKAWEDPVLREAVGCASPSLALRADRIAAGRGVPARQVLSAAVALARYQLRAAGRPTPFGLFAGVAAARFGGSARVRFGGAHQAAARCDAAWLLSVIERCEACAPLAGRLTVVFSSLALLHAGKWEVPAGPDRQVIRDSPAVRAVRDASQAPVRISVLADRLSSAFPGSGDKGTRMVAELVRLGFLITSLRPAMTTTDALGHVTRELRAAGAHAIPEMAGLLEQLEVLHRDLAAHNDAGPERQGAMRERLSAAVTEISAEGRTPLCLDLRLDAEVTLPEPVGREMAAAASALIRLGPSPGGSPVWEDYHRRFTDRFGTGTLVPLLDVISPAIGLGYPAGYPASILPVPPERGAGRHEHLAQLITGEDEVTLTDGLIDAMTGSLFDPRLVPAHVEIAARVRAASVADLDAGRYILHVSPARAAGTLTSRFSARGPSWAAADASLARTADGSLAPRVALGGLTLSGGGGRLLATARSGDRSLSVTWPRALPVPAVSGARATYPGVFPGVDLVVTAGLAGGFSETLVIEDKAAAADPQLKGLTLGLRASPGLTAHARGAGSVAVETASGKPVFFSPPPAAWNSDVRGSGIAGPAPGARTAPAPAAYSPGSVRLSIPASLLSGPASSFPVYVDPSYSLLLTAQGYGEIQSGYPNAAELNGTYDGNASVGYDGGGIDRGEYVFGLPAPADSAAVTVTAATMTATADKTFTSSSTSHTVNASYVTQYGPSSTWNNPPTVLAGPAAQTFTTASTAPSVPVSWNVASWLQSAYSGSASQMSVQLANTDETDSGPFVEFASSPSLSYTYTQPAPSVPAGTGPVPNATFLSFPVSDKVSLRVNAGSGNALVTTSDLTLPEIGSSLTLGTAYNSLLAGSAVSQGADGTGWRQREGADVRLYLGADTGGTPGPVVFLGEDGTFSAPPTGSTIYGSPAVFHTTLTTTVTSPCTGSAYQLTWHANGKVMCFNSAGLLTSQYDRNGNATAYAYNGTGQETQVTYTPKGLTSPTETVTVSYTGSYLTGLTESDGAGGTKRVIYTVNSSGDLASVQQPDGATITLGYDGSHDLTSIENGAGATTVLTYNSARQVTSVAQPYGSSGSTATTRLSYPSATQTLAAAPDTNQSLPVSSVPDTTYTVNAQEMVTSTADPAGNTQTAAYNARGNVTVTTNALSGGTTTNTWGSNAGESLTSTATPTGAKPTAAYANMTTAADPTAQYLPTSSTDAQGNTTAYVPDGAGNLASTTNNATAAAATVTYNADGTPATSTDPPPATGGTGGKTTYTYNSLHQLTKVTPPTSGSLLPVTLTYDGFGRVATVTDGDGNTVTYTYDAADRITQQAYTGGPHTLTVNYYYDGAGNLHSQYDPSGGTTWTYDGRNQVLTRAATSGGGTLTYGYDADGNMTSAQDAAGTTTYAYNTQDQLTSLTDTAGELWEFTYNNDGQRTGTYYDSNTAHTTWAADEAVSYDASGRITSIKAYGNSGATTLSNLSYCYNTAISGTACSTATGTDTSLVQDIINNQTSAVTKVNNDPSDRLAAASASGTPTYVYDSDGNMTSGGPSGTLTYNTSNQIADSSHVYDGAGNITANPNNGTQTYNDAGQLISASAATGGGGSGSETFTYAGATQQQPLSDGSATGITYGLGDQYGQPWIDSYTTGGTADYVIRDQQGDPLGMTRGTSSYMFITDNLGSVTTITGTCDCAYATYTYSPYGSLTAHTGSYTQNLIRYTGALTDTGTGTGGTTGYVHDGNRWYNTATATFITQDANSYLASPANGNRYAYAADNPINYTDPTGQASLSSLLLSFTSGLLGGLVCGGILAPIAPPLAVPAGAFCGAVVGTAVTALTSLSCI